MTSLSHIVEKLRALKQRSGLSMRQISYKMGLYSSPSQVIRLVNVQNPHNMTLKTLFRFAEACGYVCNISFKKKEKK